MAVAFRPGKLFVNPMKQIAQLCIEPISGLDVSPTFEPGPSTRRGESGLLL